MYVCPLVYMRTAAVFLKGCKFIDIPLIKKRGPCLLPWIWRGFWLLWWVEYGTSDTMWFPRLGSRRPCSFPFLSWNTPTPANPSLNYPSQDTRWEPSMQGAATWNVMWGALPNVSAKPSLLSIRAQGGEEASRWFQLPDIWVFLAEVPNNVEKKHPILIMPCPNAYKHKSFYASKFGMVCDTATDYHKKGPSRCSCLSSQQPFTPFSLSADHTNPY